MSHGTGIFYIDLESTDEGYKVKSANGRQILSAITSGAYVVGRILESDGSICFNVLLPSSFSYDKELAELSAVMLLPMGASAQLFVLQGGLNECPKVSVQTV